MKQTVHTGESDVSLLVRLGQHVGICVPSSSCALPRGQASSPAQRLLLFVLWNRAVSALRPHPSYNDTQEVTGFPVSLQEVSI